MQKGPFVEQRAYYRHPCAKGQFGEHLSFLERAAVPLNECKISGGPFIGWGVLAVGSCTSSRVTFFVNRTL